MRCDYSKNYRNNGLGHQHRTGGKGCTSLTVQIQGHTHYTHLEDPRNIQDADIYKYMFLYALKYDTQTQVTIKQYSHHETPITPHCVCLDVYNDFILSALLLTLIKGTYARSNRNLKYIYILAHINMQCLS